MRSYSEQTFESIKYVNEYGEEYWLARELQSVLEYAQWRRFSDAIEHAKLPVKTADLQSQTILPTSAKWLTSEPAQSVRLMMLCFCDSWLESAGNIVFKADGFIDG